MKLLIRGKPKSHELMSCARLCALEFSRQSMLTLYLICILPRKRTNQCDDINSLLTDRPLNYIKAPLVAITEAELQLSNNKHHFLTISSASFISLNYFCLKEKSSIREKHCYSTVIYTFIWITPRNLRPT